MYCWRSYRIKLYRKEQYQQLFNIPLGKSNPESFETFSEFSEMNLSELKNVQHIGILDLVHLH